MLWIALGVGVAVLVVIGAAVFWRIRKRRQTRLISLVALLREPVTFDTAVLASVAGKVWNADLGDGSSEGAEGFVVGIDVMNTIMHDGRMFLINCFPHPYTEDPETAAEAIPDMRIRSLFSQHQAWFSCDALGCNGLASEEEVLDWYGRLGKLFAELLDENCLLIFVPDSSLAYPINENTEMALRSSNPIKALQDTLTVPILEVSHDKPLMREAVAKARQNWPTFVAAFEARAGENFSVKAPVTYEDRTEFIWVAVTTIEGERIYGELGNEPCDLGPLKLGSKVSVRVKDLNDWCYVDAQGNLTGGFTVEAVHKASQKPRKQ